jgi:quercetin dioxygenase-like cupin family protein
MWNWLRSVFRGPTWLAAAVALATTLVAIRLAPGDSSDADPVYYLTGEAAPAEAAANITAVEVGRHESASVHHLRVAEAVKGHIHRAHDEQVVVLDGEGTMRLGEASHDVVPGSVIVIPRGTVHSLVVTRGPVEAVSVFSPPFDGKDRHFVD